GRARAPAAAVPERGREGGHRGVRREARGPVQGALMTTVLESIDRAAQDRLYVGGEWVDAADGGRFETLHPANGEVLAEVAEGGAADIDRAVAAARAAFEDPKWRRMDAADRGAVLWRMADIMASRFDALARLETLDNGKPIREAQIDVRQSIDALRYYAGWTTKLHGATIPVRGNLFNYTLR